MTGLTTHKADWKGNFLVVDQQTLNDLGGKADEFLAASGDREAFAQSLREAVYRAHAEALQNYEWWHNGCGKGDQQKAHTLRRSAFSAYLFQIIGNKHVLLWCIQHPICSGTQPAEEIRRFMTAWEREKAPPDHEKTMQIPERRSLKRKATVEEEEKSGDIQSAVLHSLQAQDGGSSTPSSRHQKAQVDADCRAQIFEKESDRGG